MPVRDVGDDLRDFEGRRVKKTSVIVVGYGPEPQLERCLWSIASDMDTEDEILLVDNGVALSTERRSSWPLHLRVVTPGSNVGFAEGANAGAAVAEGSVLVFVNSDLVLCKGAIRALAEAARCDRTLLATGSVRLSDQPDVINSAGNPVHYTGIAWAGAFGEPATHHAQRRAVASASGGFMAADASHWQRLGGFQPDYFMYHEDVEFSLRWWMTGGRVEYVPEAVGVHDYEFARNPGKMYYLERNRLITVLTTYPRELLIRVLPVLLATEVGLLLLAGRQGWMKEKLRSYGWVIRRRGHLRQRRADVQASFTVPTQLLTELLSPRLETAGFGHVPGLAAVNALLSAYWRGVRPTM